MTLILIFFSLLFLLLLKNRSVALFLTFVQLISISGTYFLGREMLVDTMSDLGWVFMIILLIFLLILPWRNYYQVNTIADIDQSKLKKITTFLIVVNSIVFFVFLVAAILVQTTVEDINKFKYSEGVSMDFYYSNLPFPTVFFNFAIVFYYFSYFMLPLHFYYLFKKRYWLSLVCFIFSLNIILYGLTFFSRAVIIQYFLLYIALLYLLYGTLAFQTKRIIKILFVVVGSLSLVYFIDVSQRRFDDDNQLSKDYSKTIPVEAITQDPVLYGYLDYLSQGFYNGYEVLQMYEGEGFSGAITLESFRTFFSTPMESHERLLYRQKLWPRHYSYSFNGFPAYAVYDYGIIGSVLFCLIYLFIVRKMRPLQNTIELKNLFLIVLLIQIPLMSIFYSQVGGLFIAFLLWIPLVIYLNIKFKQ